LCNREVGSRQVDESVDIKNKWLSLTVETIWVVLGEGTLLRTGPTTPQHLRWAEKGQRPGNRKKGKGESASLDL